MRSSTIRVLACSPRASGNTDLMVHNFVQGVRASGGTVEVSYLRDYTVLPCAACHFCDEDAEANCVMSKRDDAETLFRQIDEARLVCVISPIFFYHLPAQLKALVDRSQRFWVLRQQKLRRQGANWQPGTQRPGIVGLVAARTRGDKLFEGSLLTLKYFFDLFDIRVMDGCQLMGYDKPDELANDGVACMQLYEMGVKAAALVVEHEGQRFRKQS